MHLDSGQDGIMEESYFWALWRFAVRGFALKTDTMQIILASVVPAAYYLLGKPMPEGTTSAILAYVGMTTLTFVAMRFIVAPYFVWKEQNGKIRELRNELDAPDRATRVAMKTTLFNYRTELVRKLIAVKHNSINRFKEGHRNAALECLNQTGKYEDHFFADPKFKELWDKFVSLYGIVYAGDQINEVAAKECWATLEIMIAYLQMQEPRLC